MLAGKWISKLFEPDENKQVVVIDYERFSYEFACDMDYEKFAGIVEKYWSKVCSYATYVHYDAGKVRLFSFILFSYLPCFVLNFIFLLKIILNKKFEIFYQILFKFFSMC